MLAYLDASTRDGRMKDEEMDRRIRRISRTRNSTGPVVVFLVP